MMYQKSKEESLTRELFQNPTNEYRGAPFWAWNQALSPEVLVRHIDYFKEMGIGGFHMHCRTGLDTPYMGEEYKECVRACVEKAKAEGMYAYLYDEDRWPSGAAGGKVTKDVEYRNLGLLIVDEEQRFGVTHKEKIKQLKKDIDVLTLTATPIPRTLHMSMIGIRDMSVLEEPPMDRMPIQTYVMEYDEETVREAIGR